MIPMAQVDASEETRLRTFALEDRLVAVETAIANLHALLVPGDKGPATSVAAAESKVCTSLWQGFQVVSAWRQMIWCEESELCNPAVRYF